MRWIGKKLLAGCMTLMCGVLLAGAARALSLNVADVHNDLVLFSPNGQLVFSHIEFFLEPADDADFTLTLLDDGLELTGPMFAEDGDSAEFYFRYQVSAVNPDALINGVTLFAPSEIVDDLYPTFAKTSKTILDGPPGPIVGVGPLIDLLETFNFAGTYTELDSAAFTPRATITVIDGVRLSTGGPGDSAEVLSISNRFAVVPEPGTLVMLGGGLLGLALAGRRRPAS
ncbi:MAG TPA: PEP-CTERM sorting domain-containing protein [Myxococcota bacterium]|jgi:hypothetical protein